VSDAAQARLSDEQLDELEQRSHNTNHSIGAVKHWVTRLVAEVRASRHAAAQSAALADRLRGLVEKWEWSGFVMAGHRTCAECSGFKDCEDMGCEDDLSHGHTWTVSGGPEPEQVTCETQEFAMRLAAALQEPREDGA
jgi:hypothetical protein